MAAPAWVSRDLFEKSLRNYFKNQYIDVLNFSSSYAVPPGENFICDLFRTTINYIDNTSNKKDSLSVIVKCGNEDGGTKENVAKDLNLFEKESEMFARTFPALYKILGKYYTLSSQCFHTSVNPHSVILLEDLTTLGFNVCSRHTGFDLDHCFIVIKKIAQMHAASAIMYEKDPSSVKLYSEGLYADKRMIREWLEVGYKALSAACSRWPGFEKYGYKLTILGNEAIERGFKAMRKRVGGFHVLNHGDLWVNNMMFSYNKDGRVKDMRFIDFQMNIFTSPAIDLHYFIATSTNLEVKNQYIEIILDHYYAQLLSTLTKLQYPLCKIPTRKQIRQDYNCRAFYGLMGAVTVLPLVKATKREDASIENIIKDSSIDGYRYDAYNNERYRKHMEFLLSYYDNLGILD